MSMQPRCGKQHPRLADQQWRHSCCSRLKLSNALADEDCTAIEADIIMTASGPIMAHPPARTSDLSFPDFLELCIGDGQRHIKLDFKSIAAVEPCLTLLQSREEELQKNSQSVWLNADVIPGPNSRIRGAVVPAHLFLPLCRRLCPFALLSLGWRVAPLGPEEMYTPQDIFEMERVCIEHGIHGKDVVFCAAVRLAELAAAPLVTLLRRVPESQLLLWTGTGEVPIREGTLRKLRGLMASAGLGERVGFDIALAQSCVQHAQTRAVDCTFFCSRWTRWICCASRPRTPRIGERQPLVEAISPPPMKRPATACASPHLQYSSTQQDAQI